MNSIELELAIATYFNSRINLIVPNVSWGLNIHECDMLIVTPSNCCYEVEIKTSRSDLRADLKKGHGHNSKLIRKLFFAMPIEMESDIELVPERAGIILVGELGIIKKIREAKINTDSIKVTDKQKFQIARLGAMRIWNLKSKNIGLSRENKHLRDELTPYIAAAHRHDLQKVDG
jgi:hypothetical protein